MRESLCQCLGMGFPSLFSFFNLKHAPWFLLVGSAFGLLVLATWVFNLDYPSQSVSWLLETAGIPTESAVGAVHRWFVAPQRNAVVLGVFWAAMATLAFTYVHSVFSLDEAQAGVRGKRNYRDARQHALFDKSSDSRFLVSDADLKRMLARAEDDLKSEITYKNKVHGYYFGRISRLASASWVLVALTVEAGGFSWPWLVGLMAAGILALFVAIYAAGLSESLVERIQELVGYLLLAAMSTAVTAVGLVLFLIGRVINQPITHESGPDPEPPES